MFEDVTQRLNALFDGAFGDSVFAFYGPDDSAALVRSWCEKNFGPRGHVGDGWFLTTEHIHGCIVYFSSNRDALAFKLRWC